jgi:anti-sigma B factor antagonist
MDLQVEPAGKVTVVTIPGKSLDAGNSQEFKNDINPVLDEHKQVVFDLSELNFVDSSGCGALVSCLRRVRKDSGDLRLCRVASQVLDLFGVIRMDRIFEIFDTRDEAIAAFGI